MFLFYGINMDTPAIAILYKYLHLVLTYSIYFHSVVLHEYYAHYRGERGNGDTISIFAHNSV